MNRTIVVILVNHRQNAAPKVQSVLTGWGCMIKTRLGLHEGVLDECSESGLIILEVVGEREKKEELIEKLNVIKGVRAEKVDLELAD